MRERERCGFQAYVGHGGGKRMGRDLPAAGAEHTCGQIRQSMMHICTASALKMAGFLKATMGCTCFSLNAAGSACMTSAEAANIGVH